MGSREGLARHETLTRLCGKKPAVPSIVINEKIAFDNIPEMGHLTEAEKRPGKKPRGGNTKKPLGVRRSAKELKTNTIPNERGLNMELLLAPEEKKKIEAGIREKYAKVAASPAGLFKYPTGRAGLEALGYDPEILKTLPPSVLDSFCGVGNPFALGPLDRGETVLDIGSGGGLDSLVAARMVGPGGKVVGLDLSPEMVARANENLRQTDFANVVFQEFSGEDLPFEEGSFDVVLSNGVFNLIPGKGRMLQEACRVLKPGGRLLIADQTLTGTLTKSTPERIDSWFR
jgi:2-polyprenyl-3-methyl-5-hydroxy-6-metoxy-1,4-benzoquinol methylase